MESFLIYLLKSSGFLGIFYVSYKLFLRKETFFQGNRFFLTGGLIASLLLPMVVFTKVVWIAPMINISPETTETFITAQVPLEKTINWWLVIAVIYSIGFLFFLGRLMMQLISLLQLFKRSAITKEQGFYFVKTSDNTSPFSFFSYIVYNPNLHSTEELRVIIEHEKVHSKQFHSIDILLGHLTAIFLWVNPLAWLFKKSIAQNLEYVADNNISSETTTLKSYQYMLLKVATASHQYSITNNFFNSLIKKRIVMLNQHQSQKQRAWKYALILPLLAAFMLSFSTKTIYKTKSSPEKEGQKNNRNELYNSITNTKAIEFVVSKDTSTEASEMVIQQEKKSPKPPYTNNANVLKTSISKKEKTSIVPINDKIVSKEALNEQAHDNVKSWEVLQPEQTDKQIEGKEKYGALAITKKEKADDVNEVIEFKVTKDTSKEQLDAMVAEAKKEGFILSFKRVKRNSNGEIVAIKISFDNKKGSKSSHVTNSTNPIKPIIIRKDFKHDVSIKTIKHKKAKHKSHKIKISHEEHEDDEEEYEHDVEEHEDDKNISISLNGNTSATGKVTTIQASEGKNITITQQSDDDSSFNIKIGDNEDGKIKLTNKGGKKPLFIVDGKEISEKDFKKINPDEIESVSVLKGKSAVKKYGKKAKNGVVEIILKK